MRDHSELNEERGAALLYALLLIMLLYILVTQIAFSSKLLVSVTSNTLADLRNNYAVTSGYRYASLWIAADTEHFPRIDTLHEEWAQPIPDLQVGDARVGVQIEDEQRKLNIGRILNSDGDGREDLIAQINRLAEYLGHEDDLKLGERIADYIDENTEGDFEGGAKNEKLFNLDEILRIPAIPTSVWTGTSGGDEEATEGILKYLTLYPPPFGGNAIPQVNVNTAPVPVLLSLSEDMTEEIAENVVEYRSGTDDEDNGIVIQRASDLMNVEGMTEEILQTISPYITTGSFFFTIHVTSTSKNLTRSVFYVVRRDIEQDEEGNTEATTRLIYWQNERDFLRFQDPDRREDDEE